MKKFIISFIAIACGVSLVWAKSDAKCCPYTGSCCPPGKIACGAVPKGTSVPCCGDGQPTCCSAEVYNKSSICKPATGIPKCCPTSCCVNGTSCQVNQPTCCNAYEREETPECG